MNVALTVKVALITIDCCFVITDAFLIIYNKSPEETYFKLRFEILRQVNCLRAWLLPT